MNNLLRIILALLLTPAYMLADESVNKKDENDDSVANEEIKENDESDVDVEEVVENQEESELVAFPLTANEIANA